MKKIYTVIALIAGLFSVNNASAQTNEGVQSMENKKILVAYYSYSGNTKHIAESIHQKVGGDIFEIKTEGTYPAEYRPMTVQVQKEIQEGYRPKLTTSVADMEQYDVIFLGSPNWWGTITPQVSSFIETYNMAGKTVIPFITHGGGGVQRTIADITKQCQRCHVEQNGWVGYGDETRDLNEWIKKVIR